MYHYLAPLLFVRIYFENRMVFGNNNNFKKYFPSTTIYYLTFLLMIHVYIFVIILWISFVVKFNIIKHTELSPILNIFDSDIDDLTKYDSSTILYVDPSPGNGSKINIHQF
jgi:hypothetical protein